MIGSNVPSKCRSLETKPARVQSMANRSGMQYLASQSGAGYASPPDADEWGEPAAGSFALVHAGRQWRVGPIGFLVAIGILVGMAGGGRNLRPPFFFPRALFNPPPRPRSANQIREGKA